MSNLLSIICIALSIHHVLATPVDKLYNCTLLKQIIDELITLRSVPMDNILLKSLYFNPQKKGVCIEELSCRAINSIEALDVKSIKKIKLERLSRFLEVFTKDVTCSVFTYEKPQVTEDIKTFIEQLLNQFRKLFSSVKICIQ